MSTTVGMAASRYLIRYIMTNLACFLCISRISQSSCLIIAHTLLVYLLSPQTNRAVLHCCTRFILSASVLVCGSATGLAYYKSGRTRDRYAVSFVSVEHLWRFWLRNEHTLFACLVMESIWGWRLIQRYLVESIVSRHWPYIVKSYCSGRRFLLRMWIV